MKAVLEPTKEMLAECRAGNQTAFKELFYMYRSYAYNLIYKITGPRGDHEDLLQEAFFQMYLSLRSFQGESTFKTWFHRMIFHSCTRSWRYQQADKRISPKDTVSMDAVEYALHTTEDSAHKQVELRDLVDQAMDSLDYKVRFPLVLSVYSELDLSEIAQIMGIPEGTVKSRLFTARKRIREFLDGLET